MYSSVKVSASCHDRSDSVVAPNDLPVITLVGQPNSGKTTLFNLLTGSNFKTANYAGSTVEFSVGKFDAKYDFNALIIDSPGVTSIHPQSPDEETTIDALFHHPVYKLPDLIIVTADSSQLSRQLYLVHQLIESGFNVVVALTMNDLLERKGFELSVAKSEELLKCPVVRINGRTGEGLPDLISRCRQLYELVIFENAKKNIKRPAPPTEESVIALYSFTENIEKQVVLPRQKPVDIHAVNKKIFNVRSHDADEHSVKLDKLFLHPFWGLVFFIVSMSAIFTSIFWLAQPIMDGISEGFGLLSSWTSALLPPSWLSDLVAQGIIAGIGMVATFLPQIVILFLFLGILEDTGYLARGAMLIDKPLSKIGLNGRSFVPMLSGFACAIPAIMAARTISNRRERLLTIFIIPLMSCSARLPVYALLLALVVPPDKPWIAGLSLGAIYLTSLTIGAIAAGIISKLAGKKGNSAFMLELPAYRKPVVRYILKGTYYKSVLYIQKAGGTIVFCSLFIWALTYFPNTEPALSTEKTKNLTSAEITKLIEFERTNTSYAASIGHMTEPFLEPLGWDWRVGVSLISAFVAREVFVSAMALSLRISENGDDLQASMLESMHEAKIANSDKPLFTTASTIGLIIFFMIAMQCISTLAISRKETGSWKIPIIQQSVYSIAAYIAALAAVNGLRALGIQ
ncbi:ferrous iron transport protein B [bacterium]|nr:MAG: ferrous iron transport protein B [bacterium]